MHKAIGHARKVGIAIVGSCVVIIGIIAIPYPGPGWLIVFAGLAILATEFTWAQHLLDHARGKYDMWLAWLKRQSLLVKAMVTLVTAFVVVGTLWFMNGYGMLNQVLGLQWDWLQSPFVRE